MMADTASLISKVPVSILIPIKNEAANLPRCLASVLWANEIFVVDSHSIDGSQDIAESYGAKVVQFEFNGTWPKKKNWALDNLPFANAWVFILDADEVLPPEAKEVCIWRRRNKSVLDQSSIFFPGQVVTSRLLS
jgi:glycosyltransferase involved in cell wall biosynthesis